MDSSSLLPVVLNALRDRPRRLTFVKIGEDLDINEAWLERLALGRVKEPSVNKIERLYTYFTGHDLSKVVRKNIYYPN